MRTTRTPVFMLSDISTTERLMGYLFAIENGSVHRVNTGKNRFIHHWNLTCTKSCNCHNLPVNIRLWRVSASGDIKENVMGGGVHIPLLTRVDRKVTLWSLILIHKFKLNYLLIKPTQTICFHAMRPSKKKKLIFLLFLWGGGPYSTIEYGPGSIEKLLYEVWTWYINLSWIIC